MLDADIIWMWKYDWMRNICIYWVGSLVRWWTSSLFILSVSRLCKFDDSVGIRRIWIEISKVRIIILLQLDVLRRRHILDHCMEP